MNNWYETHGDRYCKKCGKLIKPDKYGNFCYRHASDLLMGVGAVHYPTPEDFIKEAEKQGCSKRIGNFYPDDVKPGKSRCFLMHNTTKEIFGFYLIEKVEVIISQNSKVSEYLKSRGIKPISIEETEVENERGCGSRVEGGAYVVSYNVTEKQLRNLLKDTDFAESIQIRGPLVVFEEPIPYKINYTIRGFIYVNGEKILERAPQSEYRWQNSSTKPQNPNIRPLSEYFFQT